MREIFFNSFKEKILNGQVPQSFDVTGVPVNSKFFDSYDNTDISIEQYKNLSDFDTYARNVDGIPKFEDTVFEYSSYGVEYSAYQNDDIGEKPIFVNSDNSAKFFQIYGEDFDEVGKNRMIEYMTLADPSDIEKKDELRNTNSGFYYVTKKTQLNWLADRCNDENNYNNKIRIVLGDDIGNMNDMDTLQSMICTTPERPFQGIFDMNGHKLVNKRFICDKNSNGLIGYLGPKGIVRNGIVENITFVNQKKISLDKIVNDCSDVVAGALVGTNFGTVENIVTSGSMEFNGFCPEVYLVNNKYEYVEGDTTNNNSAYNGFYPNKFCINSIYNVLPYCGYFAEGADSYFNDIGSSKYWLVHPPTFTPGVNNLGKQDTLTMLDDALDRLGFSRSKEVDEYGLQNKFEYNNYSYLGFGHYDEPKDSISDGYDQAQIRLVPMPFGYIGAGYHAQQADAVLADLAICSGMFDGSFASFHEKSYIAPMVPMEYTQLHLDRVLANTINGLGTWKAYEGDSTYTIAQLEINDEFTMWGKDMSYASYLAQQLRDTVHVGRYMQTKFTHHQRMNPNVRIAYFCSPIVGNNFGIIRNVDCCHSVHESKDTFVGFIGGVCGKENCGRISAVNTTLDIVENNVLGEDSGAQNLSRIYTKQKKYLPDYGEDYANLTQTFVYNWDRFQTSAGLTDEELETYSAVSGDCVAVSEKFYDFHDFVCSGVNGDWYKEDDTSWIGHPAYVFNRYENKSPDYANCNFRVKDDVSSDTIGSTIPQQIREAKLKFGGEDDGSEFKFYFEVEVTKYTSGSPESGDYYEKEYPFQGEVKIFNDYNESWKANTQYPLMDISDEAYSAVKEDLQSILSFDVKHMSVDYLGDAAKSVMTNDKPNYMNTVTKADGTRYNITLDDAMSYCNAFNGDLGNTRANANAFARNIMNAKIAMGADVLASQYIVGMSYVNYSRALGFSPYGNFNKLDGSDDWDNRTRDMFIISGGVGPNDTTSNWEVYDIWTNSHGVGWYGSPCPNTFDGNGPAPKLTNQMGYGIELDIGSYNPSLFCSTREDMLWDLCNKNMDLGDSSGYYEDGSIWRTSAFTEEERKDLMNFGLQRSMITIDPVKNETTEQKARALAIWIAENTTILKMMSGKSNLPQDSTALATLFGSNWTAMINTVRIPMYNRNQNKIEVKENLEGVAGVNGLYFKQVHGITRTVVDKVDGKYVTVVNDEWREMYQENRYNSGAVGNIDDMFVDLSIIEKVSDRFRRKYNVIVKIPLKSIRFPISAFERGGISDVNTTAYTVDLAHSITEIPESVATHKERNIKFYPLVPAYDPTDTNGNYVEYKLKSIYNIGGVAGMINHSEKNIQYGNNVYMPDTSSYGVNMGDFGGIYDVNAMMSPDAARFINHLCMVKDVYGSESFIDANDRVIGIASKFSMIAPVYEYHQNENGTSPDPGYGDDYNTNGLTRTDLDAQVFRLDHINCIGAPSVNLDNVNSRIFKPMIEWANASNVLDYNNFFDARALWKMWYSCYLGHSSSNYPESVNILHNYCSIAMGDVPTYYDDFDCKLRGTGANWLSRRSYPLAEMNQFDTEDGLQMFGFVSPSAFYQEGWADWGETITTQELKMFGDALQQTHDTVRNIPRKGLDLFPEFTVRMTECYIYENGTTVNNVSGTSIHMSMAIKAPNSDYYDIYNQLLDGSPNFCFTKLNKNFVKCDFRYMNRLKNPALPANLTLPMRNAGMINLYGKRTTSGIRDRYFTWDYDMSKIANTDLKFTIKYKRVNQTRGLWIHQNDKRVEENEYLQYAMKGANECINDGSNVHLGYMPSEWALINIMNREDDNSRPQNRFDEGVAIDGEDYRGMLLYDKNKDLVAVLDAGSSRDISSGCYIGQFPKTASIDGKRYGLLTEIEVE